MSKKHFISIGRAIRENGTFTESQLETLSEEFKRINPRFNRSRWIGFIKGENGPNGGTL